MRHARFLLILCTVLNSATFAQDSSVNIAASVGYLYPAPAVVAPGQVITVFVSGSVSGNLTATVRQVSDFPAPVLNVRAAPSCINGSATSCSTFAAVTIQIPYELRTACLVCASPGLTPLTELFISQDGKAGASIQLTPLADHVHILTTCDTVVSSGNGYPPWTGLPCTPFVTHGDGSLVSAASPASPKEELVAYAVGLGATNPPVTTGQAASEPVPTQASFRLSFNYQPNALAAEPYFSDNQLLTAYAYPVFAGLAAGYPGLYQINFVVEPPFAEILTCGSGVASNLTVNFGGPNSFDGAAICVEP